VPQSTHGQTNRVIALPLVGLGDHERLSDNAIAWLSIFPRRDQGRHRRRFSESAPTQTTEVDPLNPALATRSPKRMPSTTYYAAQSDRAGFRLAPFQLSIDDKCEYRPERDDPRAGERAVEPRSSGTAVQLLRR
jgi:hypothetical protein